MRIKAKSFPYPILSKFNDDIMPNNFDVSLGIVPTKIELKFKFKVSLEHASLEKLITDASAVLILHVECQSNFYRNTFSFNSLEGSFEIPITELSGRVDVSFVIVSCADNDKYMMDGFHQDYEDLVFSIVESDILALLETKYFIVEKDPNVLRKIASIIQVVPLKAKNAVAWEINLDSPKIFVHLPIKDFEKYYLLRDSKNISGTLTSIIVIPALMEAIQQIRTTDESDLEIERERRWFSVLERKLIEIGENLSDSQKSNFEIAQIIMEHSSVKSLEELEVLSETGE